MRLVNRTTGKELKEGDEMVLGRKKVNISCLDPTGNWVHFMQEEGVSFPLRPNSINCEWRQ